MIRPCYYTIFGFSCGNDDMKINLTKQFAMLNLLDMSTFIQITTSHIVL